MRSHQTFIKHCDILNILKIYLHIFVEMFEIVALIFD